MPDMQNTASRILMMMELSTLNDDDSQEAMDVLCQHGKTDVGNVAAISSFACFVSGIKQTLVQQNTPDIKVAAVVNYPYGHSDIKATIAETISAVESSADEIDLAFPSQALLEGDAKVGSEMIRQCKAICGLRPLKAIIETGALKSQAMIQLATVAAIESGADFIQTSTGKAAINATPDVVKIILNTICEVGGQGQVGIKVVGGMCMLEDVMAYLTIADEIMGERWAHKNNFRLSCSCLLANVLQELSPLIHHTQPPSTQRASSSFPT